MGPRAYLPRLVCGRKICGPTGSRLLGPSRMMSPAIGTCRARLVSPSQSILTSSTTSTSLYVLLVIMMPTLLLGALLNMLMAALNSVDRFVGPALIFLALNGGIIGTVILLAPVIGIYSVALGFPIGALLQVLVQSFELKRERGHYFARIDLHHPAVRQICRR